MALGKNHRTIGEVSEKHAYLDPVIDKMLQQKQESRYQDIAEIKLEISARTKEYISSLKISALRNTAIPKHEVDDPIVSEPMRIIGADWDQGVLRIQLNHAPTPTWGWALLNMGGHSAVSGKGPEVFQFRGNEAIISAQDGSEAQTIIDYFKQWLPRVAQVYEQKLKLDAEREESETIREIERRIAEEEKRKSINAGLKF